MSFEKTNIKVVGWTQGFVMIPNSFAQDHTLSHTTRSALLDTFSRDEQWETTVAGLMAVNNISRDVARRVLVEAEASGYGHKRAIRQSGRFCGDQWFISPDKSVIAKLKQEFEANSPETEKPAPVKPATARPATEKPAPVKQHQLNKESNERKNELNTPLTPQGGKECAQETSIEEEATSSKPKKAKRKVATAVALPEDWAPTEKMLTDAMAKYGLTRAAVEFETFEQFREYWNANGRFMKDWNATWRKWIAKAASNGIRVPANYRQSARAAKEADAVAVQETQAKAIALDKLNGTTHHKRWFPSLEEGYAKLKGPVDRFLAEFRSELNLQPAMA